MNAARGRPRSGRRITPTSTVDALAANLKDAVLDGVIPPGAHLPELELTRQYGVSRHSLRTAMQRLVSAGLLRHEPNKGVFVPRPSARDIEDLYRVRSAVETEAVIALTGKPALLSGPTEAVKRLEALSPHVTWREVLVADLAFHCAVVAAAGSTRLVRIFTSIEDELVLALANARPDFEDRWRRAEEHRLLLDLLGSSGAESACAAFRAHLKHSEARAQRDLVSDPEPLER